MGISFVNKQRRESRESIRSMQGVRTMEEGIGPNHGCLTPTIIN